jgi:hypothetical protein
MLHSGAGQLVLVDPASGKAQTVTELPGYTRGLALYDRFAFVGSQLPDGSRAEANYLWFADWYTQNLNAMFTAPLDYELWRWLDRRSPIASRLYEFLIINFYGAHPVLRINYETLAQFLPIKAERYRSSARRQLDPAFRLLTLSGVIDAAEWAESRRSIAQLHIRRGSQLASLRTQAALERAEVAVEYRIDRDMQVAGSAIEALELRLDALRDVLPCRLHEHAPARFGSEPPCACGVGDDVLEGFRQGRRIPRRHDVAGLVVGNGRSEIADVAGDNRARHRHRKMDDTALIAGEVRGRDDACVAEHRRHVVDRDVVVDHPDPGPVAIGPAVYLTRIPIGAGR